MLQFQYSNYFIPIIATSSSIAILYYMYSTNILHISNIYQIEQYIFDENIENKNIDDQLMDGRPVDDILVDYQPVDDILVDYQSVDDIAGDDIVGDHIAVDYIAVDYIAGDNQSIEEKTIEYNNDKYKEIIDNIISSSVSSFCGSYIIPNISIIEPYNIPESTIIPLNNNIHSLLIGYNYSNTPYELDNCIDNIDKLNTYINDTKYINNYNLVLPILFTDNNNNQPTKYYSNVILSQIKDTYNKCKNNDIIYIYYSGYCDKTDNKDVFTLSSNKPLLDIIYINDILDIFLNPNIKLILIIDSFYYDTLKIDNIKLNHLIIGSFINEPNVTKTLFTTTVLNYLVNQSYIDKNNSLWNNLQIIGNLNIIYE